MLPTQKISRKNVGEKTKNLGRKREDRTNVRRETYRLKRSARSEDTTARDREDFQ